MERRSPGLLGAIRNDLERLHATWMEVVFPRQLDPSSVVGRWRPETSPQKLAYYGWGGLGLPIVAIGYPLLLLGFATRYYARRIDSAATRLGIAGVVGVSILAWGLLTLATFVQSRLGSFPVRGILAVIVASVVATVSAALAVVFSRIDGRPVSVALAYPAAVTAIFLPPVVAALYSPTLADIIFPGSRSLAVWLLENPLAALGISEFLQRQFTLQGAGYVLMWVAISVPLGWLLGGVVALADVIRPGNRGPGSVGA